MDVPRLPVPPGLDAAETAPAIRETSLVSLCYYQRHDVARWSLAPMCEIRLGPCGHAYPGAKYLQDPDRACSRPQVGGGATGRCCCS